MGADPRGAVEVHGGGLADGAQVHGGVHTVEDQLGLS